MWGGKKAYTKVSDKTKTRNWENFCHNCPAYQFKTCTIKSLVLVLHANGWLEQYFFSALLSPLVLIWLHLKDLHSINCSKELLFKISWILHCAKAKITAIENTKALSTFWLLSFSLRRLCGKLQRGLIIKKAVPN